VVAFFEGYYVKCSWKQDTVAVIFGRSACGKDKISFIQIVTRDNSYCQKFEFKDYFVSRRDFEMRVGTNHVTKKGMVLDIQSKELKVTGKVKFDEFDKIKYDAMGPFKLLPFMECRHSVISMQHKISGEIRINETVYSFDDGVGYIEGDRGKSFPRKYFWSQVNKDSASVFASCARIPYLGIRFKGTICIIHFNGQEFRLATYLGARVKVFNESKLVIRQGRRKKKYCLEVEALDEKATNTRALLAPLGGKMSRVIQESVERTVNYKFTRGAQTIFDFTSSRAAFEYSKIKNEKSKEDFMVSEHKN